MQIVRNKNSAEQVGIKRRQDEFLQKVKVKKAGFRGESSKMDQKTAKQDVIWGQSDQTWDVLVHVDLA